MKKENLFFNLIVMFTVLFIQNSMPDLCVFAEAVKESDKTSNQSSNNTIDVDIDILKSQFVEIQDTLMELNQGIHKIDENVSLYLVKKEPAIILRYLEFSIDENILFKKKFTDSENKSIETKEAGERLISFFLPHSNDKKWKMTVRYFYTLKNDPASPLLKRTKLFSRDKKIENIISIELAKSPKNPDVDVSVNMTFM